MYDKAVVYNFTVKNPSLDTYTQNVDHKKSLCFLFWMQYHFIFCTNFFMVSQKGLFENDINKVFFVIDAFDWLDMVVV